MQQWRDVAHKAHITLDDLEGLLQGTAYLTVQERFGVSMSCVNAYINRNQASADLVARLGFSVVAAHTLGNALGRDGRIGLILGLLMD